MTQNHANTYWRDLSYYAALTKEIDFFAVLKKHGVEVVRPKNISAYNQILRVLDLLLKTSLYFPISFRFAKHWLTGGPIKRLSTRKNHPFCQFM